jgi:hypothetical protein
MVRIIDVVMCVMVANVHVRVVVAVVIAHVMVLAMVMHVRRLTSPLLLQVALLLVPIYGLRVLLVLLWFAHVAVKCGW